MAEVLLEQVGKDVRDGFNRGFAAFERGNLDYAIHLLSECLVREPGLLQARRFLRAAEIQKLKGKKGNSLSQLVSLVQGLPCYLRTMAAGKAGKTDQALIGSEELLQIDPLNKEFIKVFAQAAANANLPEAAIQTLEIARDHYPNDIRILNWLGTLYQKIGRMRSARECFETLCEITPNDPAAIKALKDAMALDSMSTDGWVEASDSGGTYRDLIKDTHEAELLEKEAKAVKSEKDADALVLELRERIEAEPANINYYRSLGRLYAQKRMFDEAVDILEKAREVSPGDPEIGNALNAVRVQEMDFEISRLVEAGDEEGARLREQERAEFLYSSLRDRVERYPNDLGLRYDWGVMLYEHGELNEAIQQFQLSQKNPKLRVRSYYYLAMCFRGKQQYDLAMQQLKTAASEITIMDETKKEIIYELGLVSEAMGRDDTAADYFKQIYQVDIGYRDVAAKIERAYGRDDEGGGVTP